MDHIRNLSSHGRPPRYEYYTANLPRPDMYYSVLSQAVGANYYPLPPNLYAGLQGGIPTMPPMPPMPPMPLMPLMPPMSLYGGELQCEKLRLQQSQELTRARLVDCNAIHSRMLHLLNRMESLQLTPTPQVNTVPLQSDPTLEEEIEEESDEEEWDEEESDEEEADPSPSSVIGFDTIRNELQNLKIEVVAAQNRLYPQHAFNPVSPKPPLKMTRPPVPPPRAHPQLGYQYPPPPPYPDPLWRTPPAWETPRMFTVPKPFPSMPKLTRRDPKEFARLKIALENKLPRGSTETFKYQIMLEHLQHEEAKLIAYRYILSTTPFSDTMNALNNWLGLSHELALRRIAVVMDTPDIRRGDVVAFVRFSLEIQSLVDMLKALGPDGMVELQCDSHVAALLSKLPSEQSSEFRRYMRDRSGRTFTLEDLAVWLKYGSLCHDFDGLPTPGSTEEKQDEDTLKQLEELQSEKQCKICMDRDLCMVFIPCGHLVSCQNCSEMLINCPICSCLIEQSVKSYIS